MPKFLDFITAAVKTRFHKGRIAIFHKIIALIVKIKNRLVLRIVRKTVRLFLDAFWNTN